MKPRFLPLLLILPALILPAPGATAPAATTAPVAARELVITVVEPVGPRPSDVDFFHRVADEFTQAFTARSWPLTVKVERFGANSPDHPLELRVFLQPVRQELPDELSFRAWIHLTVDGRKHDFGVLRFNYRPRPMQPVDEVLDRLVRGGAELAADKVGGVLFSTAAAPEAADELVLTIAEPRAAGTNGQNLYSRVAHAFAKEFESRKWPCRIRTESFAANNPAHPLRLNLVLEPLDSEWRFRAWMNLQTRTGNHDLGRLAYDAPTHQWQDPNDVADHAIAGAARIAADKVAAILFAAPATPAGR